MGKVEPSSVFELQKEKKLCRKLSKRRKGYNRKEKKKKKRERERKRERKKKNDKKNKKDEVRNGGSGCCDAGGLYAASCCMCYGIPGCQRLGERADRETGSWSWNSAFCIYVPHGGKRAEGEKEYTDIRGASVPFWNHICSASADACASVCNARISDKSSRTALHHICRAFVHRRRMDVHICDGNCTKRQKKIAEKKEEKFFSLPFCFSGQNASGQLPQ